MRILELTDYGTFYCPMTGAFLFNQYDSGDSDAVEFAFLWDISEFVSIKPEYEELYAQCEAEEEEMEMQKSAYEIFLEKLSQRNELLIFSFESHGMACGPVSSTVDYCINMAYKKNEEDFN